MLIPAPFVCLLFSAHQLGRCHAVQVAELRPHHDGNLAHGNSEGLRPHPIVTDAPLELHFKRTSVREPRLDGKERRTRSENSSHSIPYHVQKTTPVKKKEACVSRNTTCNFFFFFPFFCLFANQIHTCLHSDGSKGTIAPSAFVRKCPETGL